MEEVPETYGGLGIWGGDGGEENIPLFGGGGGGQSIVTHEIDCLIQKSQDTGAIKVVKGGTEEKPRGKVPASLL